MTKTRAAKRRSGPLAQAGADRRGFLWRSFAIMGAIGGGLLCSRTIAATEKKGTKATAKKTPEFNMDPVELFSKKLETYRRIVCSLLKFWQSAEPGSRHLPSVYYQFLAAYRQALQQDAGCTPPKLQTRHYDEAAYFYLLLGSSHGARYMLKACTNRKAPTRHLELLADRGASLWKDFVRDELPSITEDNAPAVLRSARNMFQALYAHMSEEAKATA